MVTKMLKCIGFTHAGGTYIVGTNDGGTKVSFQNMHHWSLRLTFNQYLIYGNEEFSERVFFTLFASHKLQKVNYQSAYKSI
jgi:hypothetical protein